MLFGNYWEEISVRVLRYVTCELIVIYTFAKHFDVFILSHLPSSSLSNLSIDYTPDIYVCIN